MSDTVTVVSRQSWGSRLKGSAKGIIFGLLMVLAACLLLFKNEGRAVDRYKALKEGGKAVVSVDSLQVVAGNEGKLVHTTGATDVGDLISDPEFGVSVKAVHLERTVEMYQWQEHTRRDTKKKVGGSTETTTTYSYSKGWSDRLVSSSSFQESRGHENPASMPYHSRSFVAQNVTLGAFSLSSGLIQRMSSWEDHPVQSTSALPDAVRARARVDAGAFYLGANPSAPQVGDMRISFRKVRPAVTSVVARQTGSGLEAYPTRSGGSIELLRIGTASADEMFESAKQANKPMTWALRVIGFLLMMFGFRLILGPLSVMADVLPALGNLAERGVNLLAAAFAVPLALLTIAMAWIFYRPLLAIGILLLTAMVTIALLRRAREARELPPLPMSVPPPPPPPSS
jgi:hypothetical protein